MNNGNEDELRSGMTVEPEHTNEDVDEDCAAYNISRSKELIKKLEQTAIHSATIVQRARSFHETHQMLSVSKTMSENSKGLLKLAAQVHSRKTSLLDSPHESPSAVISQSAVEPLDE